MDKKDEALKLALEGAANYIDALGGDSRKYRQALAEQPAQQQEPVAWMDGYRNIYSLEEKAAGCEDAAIPLYPHPMQHWSDCAVHNEPAYPAGKCDCGGYTSPPASKPLTDEQIAELMMQTWGCASIAPRHAPSFARAIEAAHGIPAD